MGKRISAVDLFCGAGGTSTGLALAAEHMGLNLDLTAINHWDIAIDSHSTNHPWAKHLHTGLDGLKPSKIIPGGKVDLLVASPECTHHSRARGGKPMDDQSRASAWHVLHWCQELYVKNLLLENIVEFTEWGPLGADRRPLKSKIGHTFQAFIVGLRSLGYRVDHRVINCANYGDATTRRRFFLMAHRGNRHRVWPEFTHGPDPTQDIFGHSLRRWKPAKDIIDWSIPGHSIFLTPDDVKAAGLRIKRPLVHNTLRRISVGVERYWGDLAEPFLILLRGMSKTRSVNSPIPALTAGGGHIGLAHPMLFRYNDGGRLQYVDHPISTIDTSNRIGLLRPLILNQDARGKMRTVDESLPTIACAGSHALVQPFLVKYNRTGMARPIDAPLDTVTTDDRFGLVRPQLFSVDGDRYFFDILYRMLTPKELAAAHSFPSTYHFSGTKTDVVTQIGNSVPVMTSKALCGMRLAA